jgi:hypothetical protein
MEPVSITAIYNLLTFFVGYYLGNDFYNYYKFREGYHEIKNDLNEIKSTLNYIKNK